MSCCLLLCGFSLVLMWCKAKCCPTIGGLPSCVGVMSGSLCGGVVFRGARACVEPTTFPKYVAVSMVSTSVWIPGTKLLGGFLFGLYFLCVFPVSFCFVFSRFLAEVVFPGICTAPFWSLDLHLRGTCSTLEFGSLISNSMVSAVFWSLDLSLDWHL